MSAVVKTAASVAKTSTASAKAIMEKATKAFVACSAIPQISSVRLQRKRPSGSTGQARVVNVQTEWSPVSPIAGTKRGFTTVDTISIDTAAQDLALSPVSRSDAIVKAMDDSSSIRAFSEDFSQEVVIFKNSKGDFILESWNGGLLELTVSLSDLDAHGDVYLDDSLGSLVVSGSSVYYIAEEKRPKAVSFTKGFGATFKPAKDDGGGDESKGREYDYVEDWGEQLVGKSQTVIVRLALDSGKVDVMARKSFGVEKDNPNVHKILPDNFCVGKIVAGESGSVLYGQAVTTEKRRLGFIYCDNRPSHIFRLDVDSGSYEAVSSDNNQVSARFPKFIKPSGTLLWLERDLGIDGIYPGTHANCVRLMKRVRTGSTDVVLDVVKRFDPDSDAYAGIYPFLYPFGDSWPKYQFNLGSSHVVVNTVVTCKPLAIVVDLESGKWEPIGTQKVVHDVLEIGPESFLLVGETHDCLRTPSVFFTSVKAGMGQPASIQEVSSANLWPPTGSPMDQIERLLPGGKLDGYEIIHWSHSPRDGSDVKFGSFYVGPKSGSAAGGVSAEGSTPLLIWLHGGPQSVFQCRFVVEVTYFLALGYSILAVNYRGSLGYGQDSAQSLLGNIGTNDVSDCVQAVEECLKKISHVNKDQLFLFGGSHGGFLVTHLAGQYPDMFKAVVARNPVTHIPSMVDTSDIPDWVFNETGSSYDPSAYAQPDTQAKMFRSSPAAHVQNVKAPIYFMIGSQDLRVPPHQGIQMYRALKAAGKNVRLNVFEDCHPLSKVPVHTNFMVNLATFFHEFMS